MKHHGNYNLLEPDEILKSAEIAPKGWPADQMNRRKQKYKNDKRHIQKRKQHLERRRFICESTFGKQR